MFKIINFTKDEAKVKADAELITKALVLFEVTAQVKELIELWSMDALKVIVEMDGDSIAGICCFRHGLNVVSFDATAGVIILESKNSISKLFDFAAVVAQAMNCTNIGVTLKTPLDGIEVSGYYQERDL